MLDDGMDPEHLSGAVWHPIGRLLHDTGLICQIAFLLLEKLLMGYWLAFQLSFWQPEQDLQHI